MLWPDCASSNSKNTRRLGGALCLEDIAALGLFTLVLDDAYYYIFMFFELTAKSFDIPDGA